ncbi:MAG: hypothetical protein EP330_20650 [Deltaproteobacteria bacterium]|nr:MAG: hypothetical protein EP330_20650 [Deltaproteobacteria bacterium]
MTLLLALLLALPSANAGVLHTSLPEKVVMDKDGPSWGRAVVENLPTGFGGAVADGLKAMLEEQYAAETVVAFRAKDVDEAGIVRGTGLTTAELGERLLEANVRFTKALGGDARIVVSVRDQKVFTAGDLATDTVEALDPTQVLFALDPTVELNLEVWVGTRQGETSAEENLPAKASFGTVGLATEVEPIVDVYTEVLRERGQPDTLIIEVETDGSVEPLDAIVESLQALTSSFGRLSKEAKAEQDRVDGLDGDAGL